LVGAGAAEGRGREIGSLVEDASFFAGDVEERIDLVGEDAFAAHARAKFAVVEFAVAKGADAVEDFFLFERQMFGEPLLEERGDGVREAQGDVAGEASTRIDSSGDDGRHFVIGEAGDDGSDEDAGGNASLGESFDGGEARGRRGGARLHDFAEISVESSHGNEDGDGIDGRELGEHVDVAGDEMVFGDDGDGIAEFGEDFEAAASEFEAAFDRLIAVGDAAEGDDFGLPFFGGKLFAQEFGSVFLDHDFGFEIEAGRETEVFVERAGVAVDAAVLAAAIGIDAGFESDVGAVVVSDDGAGAVFKELGARGRVFFGVPVGIGFEVEFLEAIGRIAGCAAGGRR